MAHRPDINEIIENLERQIDELRRDTASVTGAFAERAGGSFQSARDRTRHGYDDAARHMRRAARYARHEGAHMADVAREYPVTVSAATLAAAGLIGLGVWWLFCSDR